MAVAKLCPQLLTRKSLWGVYRILIRNDRNKWPKYLPDEALVLFDQIAELWPVPNGKSFEASYSDHSIDVWDDNVENVQIYALLEVLEPILPAPSVPTFWWQKIIFAPRY